jgi:aspartyl/glutamyl-tRNA(Asn/Gln) amidotransferase C subunit
VSVSREQALAIAQLARLRLTQAEADLFAGQLSGILDHMTELEQITLPESASGDDMAEARGASRPDSPGADPLHIPIAGFAPSPEQGFFTVPRLAAMDDAGSSNRHSSDGQTTDEEPPGRSLNGAGET